MADEFELPPKNAPYTPPTHTPTPKHPAGRKPSPPKASEPPKPAKTPQGETLIVGRTAEPGDLPTWVVAKAEKYRTELTERELRQCEYLAGLGLSAREIGLCLDLTLEAIDAVSATFPPFREALTRGRAKARSNVGKALYDKALSGDITAIKWWEVTRGPRGVANRADALRPSITIIERRNGEQIQFGRTLPRGSTEKGSGHAARMLDAEIVTDVEAEVAEAEHEMLHDEAK